MPAPARCATSATTQRAAAFSTSTRRARRRRSGSTSSATRWNRSAPSIRRPSAASASCASLDLVPMSEARLTTETIRAFARPMPQNSARRAGRRPLRRGQRGPPRHRPRALAAAPLRPSRHALRLCRRRAVRARRPRRGGGGAAPRTNRRRLRRAPRGLRADPASRITSRCRRPLYMSRDEWKERLAARRSRG